MGQNCPQNTNYSIMGIHFLAITKPFFANRAETVYMGTQVSFIYRLVMRNHDFDAFKRLYFWWENGCGRQAGAEGSRVSRLDQNVGPLGGIFGSTVISKKCFFEYLGPEPLSLKGMPTPTLTK